MSEVSSQLSNALLLSLLLGMVIGGCVVGLIGRYKRRHLLQRHQTEVERLENARKVMDEERSLVVRSLETQRQAMAAGETTHTQLRAQLESLQAHVRRQMQRISTLDAELEASEARAFSLERDYAAYRANRERVSQQRGESPLTSGGRGETLALGGAGMLAGLGSMPDGDEAAEDGVRDQQFNGRLHEHESEFDTGFDIAFNASRDARGISESTAPADQSGPLPVLRKRAEEGNWPELLDPLGADEADSRLQRALGGMGDEIPELDEAELAELTGEWEPLALLEGEEHN